jgi:DNA-binding transcriptional regulator YdaS (Cro superfamily)
MRSRASTFIFGVLAAFAVLGSAKILSRFIGFRAPTVLQWSKEEAATSGLIRPKEAKPVTTWGTAYIVEECLSDFRAMRRGDAALGPIYRSEDGKKLVLVFDCYRDEWFRGVSDRAIAYVYDLELKKLVAKFWVPMA